jgi:hypothetical protein
MTKKAKKILRLQPGDIVKLKKEMLTYSEFRGYRVGASFKVLRTVQCTRVSPDGQCTAGDPSSRLCPTHGQRIFLECSLSSWCTDRKYFKYKPVETSKPEVLPSRMESLII